MMDDVKQELHWLRESFKHQTPFDYDDEALEMGEDFYDKQVESNDAESNPYVRDALSRWELQLKKNALIFAALRVASLESTEYKIEFIDMHCAIELQKYLIGCSKFLYEEFTETQMRQVEKSILNAIDKGRHTAATMHSYTDIDTETIMRALNAMLQAGVLKPVETARAIKYYRA